MAINYRVDCLPKQPAGTDYRVPAGMNTIMWHSDMQPNAVALTKLISPMLNDDYVGVVSSWNPMLNDFKVAFIIYSKTGKPANN